MTLAQAPVLVMNSESVGCRQMKSNIVMIPMTLFRNLFVIFSGIISKPPDHSRFKVFFFALRLIEELPFLNYGCSNKIHLFFAIDMAIGVSIRNYYKAQSC